MAIRWGEFKANFKHSDSILSDDEPIILPRREAAKRAANPEQRKRIVFVVDPTTYSQFHEHKERIMRQLDENPVLFGVFLTDVLKGFDAEMVERWRIAHEGPEDAERIP